MSQPFCRAFRAHGGRVERLDGINRSGRHSSGSSRYDARTFLGIDLRSHVARRFAVARCLPGDLVLAFELVHAERLESLLRGRGVTVRLLGAYASPFLYHQHDPYGLADTYFHHCFDGIARSIKAMIKTMPKLAAEVPKCES